MSCSGQSFLGAGVFSVDHIEAAYLHALPPAESLKLLRDKVEVVRYILGKLHTVNPTRAELYEQWLSELLSNREFVKNFSFIPLPDSSTTMIPEFCKQEQAGLFHSVENLTQTELLELLRSLQFSRGDYNGLSLRLFIRTPEGNMTGVRLAPVIYFPDSDRIRVAPLADSFSVRIGDDVFHRVCNESFVSDKFPSFVEFYPSGKIKKMVFQAADGNFPSSYTPGYSKTQCSYQGKNKLEFNENGDLVRSSVAPESLSDAYHADRD